MRTVRTISREKQTALACRIITYALFIGYSIFFFILFYRQYTLGAPKIIYRSDLHQHIKFGKSGNMLYSLTYIILGFLDSLPHPELFIPAALLFFLLLGVVAAKVLLQFILKDWNKWHIWIFAWISNMFFPLTMPYIPHIGEFDYRGLLNFNVYHNPTYIMMKPFAIFSVYMFFRLFKKYADEGIKVSEWFIFAGLMLLTTLFKPNFMIGFSISMLCMMIFDFIKRRGKGFLKFVVFGTTVFPSIALMVYQEITLFDANSSMKIGFMTALRKMAYHPEIKLLLSLVFPIVILCFVFKDIIKDKIYAFSWLHMIINLAITVFIYETGYRANHGNFIWSSNFAIGILFIASLAKLLELAKQKRPVAFGVSAAVLGVHVFCWINYIFDIFQGNLAF